MTADFPNTAKARSRSKNVDNFIVVAATVTLFIFLEYIGMGVVDNGILLLGLKPDATMGLVVIVIIVPITIAFSMLLSWLLRRSAAKRIATIP